MKNVRNERLKQLKEITKKLEKAKTFREFIELRMAGGMIMRSINHETTARSGGTR